MLDGVTEHLGGLVEDVVGQIAHLGVPALAQLREIEDQLHTAIEATVDPVSLKACRAVLEGFIDVLPAGAALQRRVSTAARRG
jgi:hypothetical protein